MDKMIYGVIFDNSLCVCYGVVDDKVLIIKEEAVRRLVDSGRFGLLVKDSIDAYINIAMNRDYSKRQFVTIEDSMLLVSSESKPGWYLLRPDTVVGVAAKLMEDMKEKGEWGLLTAVDGDYFTPEHSSLVGVLCNYWNCNY